MLLLINAMSINAMSKSLNLKGGVGVLVMSKTPTPGGAGVGGSNPRELACLVPRDSELAFLRLAFDP